MSEEGVVASIKITITNQIQKPENGGSQITKANIIVIAHYKMGRRGSAPVIVRVVAQPGG